MPVAVSDYIGSTHQIACNHFTHIFFHLCKLTVSDCLFILYDLFETNFILIIIASIVSIHVFVCIGSEGILWAANGKGSLDTQELLCKRCGICLFGILASFGSFSQH